MRPRSTQPSAASRTAAASAARARKAPSGVGEVRIIGGQWKRTRLRVPALPGLRPTPDRVRETLFNWLGQDLTGWQVIDAFAGTGALGLEAASRGAASVLLVEQQASLVAALNAAQTRLQAQAVRVQRGDGVAALRQAAVASVHLLLLDPPFEAGDALFAQALQAAARALAGDGFIYLEAPQPWSDAMLAPLGLRQHRYLHAGAVHAHLLVLL